MATFSTVDTRRQDNARQPSELPCRNYTALCPNWMSTRSFLLISGFIVGEQRASGHTSAVVSTAGQNTAGLDVEMVHIGQAVGAWWG